MQQKICNESSKIVTRPFFDGAPNNQGCSVAAGPSRAASSGCRASERARAKSHPAAPFTLSLSKTPVAGPALARRAARARTPPGPSGSCSSTGRHPTRSRGIGRRRRDRQSGGHRRLSNEHVDDEILCAVVVALEVSKECKTKERGKSAIGTSGARGWTCPESLPQGWLSRPRRPVGLPLLKLCSSLFRTSPAKNGITWISCALSSCSSRSIDRLGYRRCATAKSVFYSADQKISLVPTRRDLGRLQS